jgi:hypothetical protein
MVERHLAAAVQIAVHALGQRRDSSGGKAAARCRVA